MKILLFIFIILAFISCGPPVNTWDPRASQSILTSKKNGLFIAKYEICNDSLNSLIEEAWVENCWLNETKWIWGKSTIKKIDKCHNLVLRLNLKNKFLKADQFLNTWKLISIPRKEYFGLLSGSVCQLEVSSDTLPATFTIVLINNGDTSKNFCIINKQKL